MKKRSILPAVIALSAAFALGASFLVVDVVKTQAAVKRTQVNSADQTVTLSSGVYSVSEDSGVIDWTAEHMTIHQEKNTGQDAVNSSYVSKPRFYIGHKITFTPTTSYPITSIKFATDGTEKPASVLANATWSTGTAAASGNDAIWTGSATTAFTVIPKTQARISAITYTYGYEDTSKTVTFNLNGGEGFSASTSVDDGGTLTKPTSEPYKANQKFTGWYTDENCTQLYDFSTTVNSNFTLYAGWKDFTDANIVNISTMEENHSYRIQGEVIRKFGNTGYVIQDSTGGIYLKGSSSIFTAKDVAIGNTIKVTGQFKLTDGVRYLELDADKANITNVDSTDTTVEVTPLTVTGDVVAANNYKYVELGRLCLSSAFSYGTEDLGLSNCGSFKLKIPAKSFVNADQESYAKDTYVDVKGFVYLHGSNLKVYVTDISESVKYTVTYHSNGGTPVDPETVFAGETFTEPTNPTKEDDADYSYVFDCWCTDEQLTTPYNFATASSSNLDLYAKYTQTEITAADYVATVNTKSQLGYDFSVSEQVDTLTTSSIGAPKSYNDVTYEPAHHLAKYKIHCMDGNKRIQMRTKNSNSGIVTTTSGGKARRITIAGDIGKGVEIYGSSTAYTSPSDLFGENKGKLIKTVSSDADKNFEIADDYEYIGMRSSDGAIYLSEVKIYWETMTISDAKLHFGGLVEKSALEDSSVAASEVGVFVARTSKLNGNAIKDVYTNPTYSSLILSSSIAYADVQATNEDGTATSGDYAIWQAALSIPSTKFTESITAVAWAKSSSDTYTFFAERSFSVVTLADAYKADTDVYNGLTDNQKASIDYLAALND